MGDEAAAVRNDIEMNLLRLVLRWTNIHYQRGNEQELRRIQSRLCRLIQDTQPGPEVEGD